MSLPLPNVFISSTIYDLRDLRYTVQDTLRKKGYAVLASEDGSIPVESSKHSYDVCLDAAKSCDCLIAVIDSRFGGTMPDGKTSITQAEIEIALNEGNQVYVFVRQSVWDAKEVYNAYTKAGHPFVPSKIVDDMRVFQVIDAIRKRRTGNWIFQFNKPNDLIEIVLFQLDSYQASRMTDSTKASTKAMAGVEVVRIKDVSTALAKRYSAFLILNQDCDKKTVHELVVNANEQLKHESYQKPGIMERLWAGKPAQVIWTFVGRSIEDIDHGNWLCRSLWVDPEVEKALSIYPLGGDENVKGIEFIWNPNYDAQKTFVASNRVTKGEILAETQTIFDALVKYSNLAMDTFSKFSAGSISEEAFATDLQKYGAEVRELFLHSGNLPFGPPDTNKIVEACNLLSGTVDEMFDAYSVKWMSEMTAQQRRTRFEMAIFNFKKDIKLWNTEWENVHQ